MGRKAVPADQPTERRMASDVFFFRSKILGVQPQEMGMTHGILMDFMGILMGISSIHVSFIGCLSEKFSMAISMDIYKWVF